MSKLGAALAIVLSVLVVGGCAALGDVIALANRIEDAGYQSVSVNHNSTNGHDVLLIQAVTPEPVATEADAERIARLVWETYPQEIDELRLLLNGRPALGVTSEELEQRFGSRPQGIAPAAEDPPYGLLIALLSAMLAITGAVVLVVVLRMRRRRRRMAGPPSS